MDQEATGVLEFWGKSVRTEDGLLWHPNSYHGLDVAACAQILVERGIAPLPAFLAEENLTTIAALVALHDIGKFSRPFQAKVAELASDLIGSRGAPPGPSHDVCGASLLCGIFRSDLAAIFPDWHVARQTRLLHAVAAHHGRPRDFDLVLDDNVFDTKCEAAARLYLNTVLDILPPSPLVIPRTEMPGLVWWLAGLTVLSDWLGSSSDVFPCAASPEPLALTDYWSSRALPGARRAIERAGLLRAAPSGKLALSALVGGAVVPSRLQEAAATIDHGPPGPVLIVIEDQTGAGKTEAALLLAHRMMREGRADGIFLALPTMATANAMYDRMARACGALFAPDATPSLVLAHGSARDHDRFQDTILSGAVPDVRQTGDEAGETAAASCAAWIADDRRKCFLASVGVGTIDQGLLAVLPARHAVLRQLGLSRRVLVIDEAHAYDAYMRQEMFCLVRFHTGLGGSTIILSATLTKSIRSELVSSFTTACGVPRLTSTSDAFPLITVATRAGLTEEPCGSDPDRARVVAVERVPSFAAAAEEVLQAARAGLAVAWIRNTVRDALEAKAHLDGALCNSTLFHSRFTVSDRQGIESDVLTRFGRPSTKRAGVVVATQVIEQSLDLDFDLVVTDIAPIDLLIQRAGRIWRHDRSGRPVNRPRLVVLSPLAVSDAERDWLGPDLRRTGRVYADHVLLWQSARLLFEAGRIVSPADIRRLVEGAYDPDAPYPAGLDRAWQEATGARSAATSQARYNLLKWEDAYDARENWLSDQIIPTRLGEPSLTLRLGRVMDGIIVPFHGNGNEPRRWSLSEVQVPLRIIGEAPRVGPEQEALVARARSEWRPNEQDIPLLPLTRDGETWVGALCREGDRLVVLHYDAIQGLRA